MEKEALIDTLKTQYSRDLRKQLVKTILSAEKTKDATETKKSYGLMNQIFSYVLKECDWTMFENSKKWDGLPLKIMTDVFPKLDTTKWYQEQMIASEKSIDVVMDQN